MTLAVLWLALVQIPAQEAVARAIVLLEAGDTEEARGILESVVAGHPDHGPARLQLGRLAVMREDWEQARDHLEIAVQSSPQRVFLAWHLLGRSRRALGDSAGAREAFTRAIDLAPRFIPSRVELAALAESEGDLWISLAQVRTAVELAPGRGDLLASLAHTARMMGAEDLARCAVERALATEPDNGALHYLRAAIEKDEAAIEACRRALELGFENAAVYVTLGNLLHEKMRLPEAMAAFEKAVALDPEAAESLASFALTSLTAEEAPRIRELLERHAEANPGSINTLYALGGMYLRDNQLARARGIFERLAPLVPGASEVHYNLAMIARREGRIEEASREMDRFRELRRKEDEEWTRQNELHRLRVRRDDRLAAGDEVEGERLARLVAESGGAASQDLVALGEVLLRLGKSGEAAASFDEALASDPYHRKAIEGRLRASEVSGDAEALHFYRTRLRLLNPICDEK